MSEKHPSAVESYIAKMRRQIIDGVIRDVAELPDRTSPEDWPEAMLVTEGELRVILQTRLSMAPTSGNPEDWGVNSVIPCPNPAGCNWPACSMECQWRPGRVSQNAFADLKG